MASTTILRKTKHMEGSLTQVGNTTATGFDAYIKNVGLVSHGTFSLDLYDTDLTTKLDSVRISMKDIEDAPNRQWVAYNLTLHAAGSPAVDVASTGTFLNWSLETGLEYRMVFTWSGSIDGTSLFNSEYGHDVGAQCQGAGQFQIEVIGPAIDAPSF